MTVVPTASAARSQAAGTITAGELPAPDQVAEANSFGIRLAGLGGTGVVTALGMKRKIALGPWFTPAFRTLYAMRGLRGPSLDPFGRTRVRATERELIEEYLALTGDLAARLSPENAALAVRLAALPDVVRGYEEVKLRNVATYRRSVAELRAELDAPGARVP